MRILQGGAGFLKTEKTVVINRNALFSF